MDTFCGTGTSYMDVPQATLAVWNGGAAGGAAVAACGRPTAIATTAKVVSMAEIAAAAANRIAQRCREDDLDRGSSCAL